MSEETPETGHRPEDELKLLKERAKLLGIPTGNSGVDALRRKIEAKLSETPEESQEEEEAEAEPVEAKPMTKAQREMALRKKIQAEQMALVRCRIYNLDPGKRDLPGEIITVGNRYLGTIRKFIPFGEATENGYHIPVCIYNDLKARKFQQIRTRNVKGNIEVDARMVPEYSIEVLPPLTKEELQELATRQAAAQRLGGE